MKRQFCLPCFLEIKKAGKHDIERVRGGVNTDHVDGLVLVDLVVYVPLSLLKTIPQKGLNMEIGDHIYQITKVHPEAGEIVLYLEMLTE